MIPERIDSLVIVDDHQEVRTDEAESLITLISQVRDRMHRHDVSLFQLIEEAQGERRVFSTLMREGLGIEADIWTLTAQERTQAFECMREWIEKKDGEDDLIEAVFKRMAGRHTVSSLAKTTGVSDTSLGRVLSHQDSKQDGITPARWIKEKQAVLQALADWLAGDSEEWKSLAETPTYTRLTNIYELANAMRGLISIIGEWGIGKTDAAEAFWRRNPKTHRSQGVVYVRLEVGDTSESAILSRIVKALHEQGLSPIIAGDPWRIIEDTITPDDLLFIDEVQFSAEKGNRGIQVFHSLFDALGAAMVLQGNPDLKGTLWNSQKSAAPALANRSLCLADLSTTEEDVDAWMDWAGYEDKALRRAAKSIAARPGPSGGLRTLVNLITAIEKLNPGEKLTSIQLNKTATLFGKGPNGRGKK